MAALLIIRSIFTKEICCARAVASEALTSSVLCDGISENATFECILGTFGNVLVFSALESLTGEGVAGSVVNGSSFSDGGGLDSARLGVLVLENVRILVGGSCNLCLERFLS